MSSAPEIISAVTTPFGPDGQIDHDAFAANLQRLEPVVDAVFVAGTTGEFSALEPHEHTALLADALAVFGPDRVVAHVGLSSTKQTLDRAAATAELGARRFAAITPYFLTASAAGTAAHYAAIRNLLQGLDFYAYLFPEVACTDVTPADFGQLVDAGIDGVKLSGLASTRVQAYLDAAPAGFKLWSGNDADLPKVLAAGGLGTVSGVSGVCPTPWADFRDAYQAGDQDGVNSAQARINVLVPALGPSIAFLKYGLGLQGLEAGTVRMSIDLPSDERKQQISEALSFAGATLSTV